MSTASLKATIKKLIFKILPESAVIMFHHVNENASKLCSGCVLDFQMFCKVVETFCNYAPLEYVLDNPNEKKIAITFDDGLEDVYTHAWPFLQARNIPFTIFIVTDFIDQPGYITKKQLQEMASDELVTVGAHGVTHEIFSKLSTQEKKIEINHSQQVLQDITRQKINIFAYSHGITDTETFGLMNSYKYGMAVGANPINMLTIRNSYALPRYNIENSTVEKVVFELKQMMRV